MTSALVLDELNLDFPPASLLILGLVVVVIVVAAALGRVVVVYEGIVGGHGCAVGLL